MALISALMREMNASMPHLELSMEDLATPMQPGALRDARGQVAYHPAFENL